MAWLPTGYLGEIIAGVAGGIVGAGLNEVTRYFRGWRQAGLNRGTDFHIAATMYPKIDPNDPSHQRYLPALEQGKTYVQELIWLGREISLTEFTANYYIYRQVISAMDRAKDAGLLLGDLPERAERPLLKKIAGYHNSIPSNDIVRLYKQHVGTSESGRVSGISPPTHEHYSGSPHRRVMRAMFIADSQLKGGIPPKETIHFHKGTHQNRYNTLMFLIEAYNKDPDRFKNCFAYF